MAYLAPRRTLDFRLCLRLLLGGVTGGLLLSFTALAETPPPLQGYEVRDVAGAGTLRGRIAIEGERPVFDPLPVTTDRAGCGAPKKPSEVLIAAPDGGLANVIVALEEIRAGKAPDRSMPPVLDQLECVFAPHVGTAYLGETLVVKNSDPVFHNVHAYSWKGLYTRFNISMPFKGAQTRIPLDRPEVLDFRCDAGHRWMSGYLYVAKNPYFDVSAPDGTFLIDRVPPGPHDVTVWHEYLGEWKGRVEVPSGGTAALHLEARAVGTKGFTRVDPPADDGSGAATSPSTSSTGAIDTTTTGRAP